MKLNITLIILLLIPFYGIKAQKPIMVYEDSLIIGQSQLPGLSVTIPEADMEKTLKEWINELQSGTRSKVVTDNNEMSIFGAKIVEISSDPVNVYSRIVPQDSMLRLYASFELKKDIYIEPSNSETGYASAYNYLKEFSKKVYIAVANDQADAEESKLRDLQKELSSLENEKSRMQRSIQSKTSSIASEKENIGVKNNEISAVSAALAEQNALLVRMEAGPAHKEKTELIKELEKRKKRAENSIRSSENKIRKAGSDIDRNTEDLPTNERMQEKVKEDIAAQEAVYQRFLDKLKTIKSY